MQEEIKNQRINEEQQEKERYIKFYNELNIWNNQLQEKEIETILTKLKIVRDSEDYQALFVFNSEYSKILLDYITNLQEENEYFNYCDEEKRKKITNLEYKIERLEEDNKQLKEENERLNMVVTIQDELEKYLEEQNDEHYSWHYREWIRQVLDKLNELKGDNK